jgi:hypothetical protein
MKSFALIGKQEPQFITEFASLLRLVGKVIQVTGWRSVNGSRIPKSNELYVGRLMVRKENVPSQFTDVVPTSYYYSPESVLFVISQATCFLDEQEMPDKYVVGITHENFSYRQLYKNGTE